MPSHTVSRAASAEEQAFLQDALSKAATTGRRWREGAESALVLWAISLLICVGVWWALAWLIRRLLGSDVGLRSAAAPWILGSAMALCAVLAVVSSVRWVKRWKDVRPALIADLAAGQVVEEHYVFDAAQRFQDPEHGALIYFLRTPEGRVLTLYDLDSADLGMQQQDPLMSPFQPMSQLVMVRAPHSGRVISQTFSGEALEAGEPVELTVSPTRWPEPEAYCNIPWDQLASTLAPKKH